MKILSLKNRALVALMGTTIGAGIFALPYIFLRLGFFVSILLLFAVSFFSTFINQTYVKIIERTHGNHQLPGYASIYLGNWGKWLTFGSLSVGLYGALTAYLVQGGQFISILFGFDHLLGSWIFWLFFSVLVVLGLAAASWVEAFVSTGLIFLIGLFSLFSLSSLSWGSVSWIPVIMPKTTSLLEVFSLFGVVLFAFGGTSAVPEVAEILRDQKHNLRGIVQLSSILVTFLYLLFAVSVVFISGQNTSPAALEGLASSVGGVVQWLFPLIGVLSLGSSFLLLSYSLREIFFRDFRLPIVVSWLFSLVPPLVIFICSRLGFVEILSLAGSAGIGLSWILILLIYWSATSRLDS